MWVCSGSALVAEICAGAGLDWLLIDAEHSPNSLESVLAQLQAARAYPAPVVVRVEANDPVLIKRYLDLGATSLLIPMVNNADEAQAAVAATRYPPEGVRGVGSALARSGRWSRIPGYLNSAAESLTVLVQLESLVVRVEPMTPMALPPRVSLRASMPLPRRWPNTTWPPGRTSLPWVRM